MLARRSDGYHNLSTVFVPVRFHDVLEILPAATDAAAPVALEVTGIAVTNWPADNLCVQAWHLLKKDFPQLPQVRMHLHKIIPAGAGLGGGSADAAFALAMLNDLFKLNIDKEQLANYALELGSDCPFFLHRQSLLATGRGEIFSPVEPALENYALLLLTTPIHVSTGWAFSQVSPANTPVDLGRVITQPIASWRHHLTNDFEVPVFAAHPVLAQVKASLYEAGALYASMTGSGSTLFAFFENKAILPALPQGFTPIWTQALTMPSAGY